MINLIMTDKNSCARIVTPDGETDLFEILLTFQGDTLVLYLFSMAFDNSMKRAIGDRVTKMGFQRKNRKSRRQLPDLYFADDIALLAEEATQAQDLLSRVKTATVVLHLIAKKVKLTAFDQESPVIVAPRSDHQGCGRL